MDLHLSNNSPRSTVLHNSEGQAIYKIVTPMKLGKRTTTVSKILPISSAAPPGDMRDKFAHVAQIDWPIFARDRLRMQGQEMAARSYLQGDGLFNQHRVFTGPDGRLYRWNMGAFGTSPPLLETADKSKKMIAKFHRKRFGFFGKPRQAYLEVLEDGIHLLDQIVITFIFVEKLRRDREDRRSQAGGSASAAAC